MLSDYESKRERLQKRGRLQAFHWLVVGGSLCLTIFAWYMSREQVATNRQARFDSEAIRITQLIKERVVKYEDALLGGVAYINATDGITSYLDWKRFAHSLQIHKKYPGINGIGVIYQINPNDKETFIENERKLRPDFSIHPVHDTDDMWPITLIEPLRGNEQAVGLDIAFEKNRHSAALAAKESGKTTMTGPIVLVQDSKKTPGFLLYAPYYSTDILTTTHRRKESFLGVVYAPFIVSKLIAGALENEQTSVDILVRDGPEVLYDESDASPKYRNTESSYFKETDISLYGRTWTFEVAATASSFDDVENTHQAEMILAGGLFINSLLLFLFLTISRTSREALNYADKMNADLVKSTKELQRFALVASDELREPLRKVQNLVVRSHSLSEHTIAPSLNIKSSAQLTVVGRLISDMVGQIAISQEQLQEAHDNLEKVVESRTEELERFVYTVSHDLRSPLITIKGFIGSIEEDVRSGETERLIPDIRRVSDAADRMSALLDQLLELSRIGRVDRAWERVDISELVNDVVADLQGIIVRCGATVDVQSTMPSVFGDRVGLFEVFQNLIENSLKYRQSGVTPMISVGFTRENEDDVFYVRDNGIGIKECYLGRIYNLFEQLNDAKDGTGIGLSIVKRVIDTHKGNIWATSDGEGTGTTFFIKLDIINGNEAESGV